jgi:hypothetical protein
MSCLPEGPKFLFEFPAIANFAGLCFDASTGMEYRGPQLGAKTPVWGEPS